MRLGLLLSCWVERVVAFRVQPIAVLQELQSGWGFCPGVFKGPPVGELAPFKEDDVAITVGDVAPRFVSDFCHSRGGNVVSYCGLQRDAIPVHTGKGYTAFVRGIGVVNPVGEVRSPHSGN